MVNARVLYALGRNKRRVFIHHRYHLSLSLESEHVFLIGLSTNASFSALQIPLIDVFNIFVIHIVSHILYL
jgi:hypothetical protein